MLGCWDDGPNSMADLLRDGSPDWTAEVSPNWTACARRHSCPSTRAEAKTHRKRDPTGSDGSDGIRALSTHLLHTEDDVLLDDMAINYAYSKR